MDMVKSLSVSLDTDLLEALEESPYLAEDLVKFVKKRKSMFVKRYGYVLHIVNLDPRQLLFPSGFIILSMIDTDFFTERTFDLKLGKWSGI